MIPYVLILAAAALSPSQARQLERIIICPEKLPSDDARFAAVKRFMNGYARIDPRATAAERMAFRARVLARKRCRGLQSEPHYSFPET